MAHYSRRASVEERKNKRKAFIFVFLTITLVAGLFYFGIPAVIKYTGFLTDLRQSAEPIESSDTTPPPPPRLDPLPEATKDSSVDINGSTEPGVRVILKINGKEKEVLTNKDGRFSYTLNLEEGRNTVRAKSKDSAGNESNNTQVFTIVYDQEAPKLEILSPEDGTEFFGNSQRQISIEGSTDSNASITINGRFVLVGSDGKYKFNTNLSDGDNEFTIKAEDKAGNATETKIILKYSS